jgi:hypothetical protein
LKDSEQQLRAAETYINRFPMVKRHLTPKGLATDQTLIRITPERIYFSDYSKGSGHREKLDTF